MSVVASTVSSVWVVLFDDPQDLDSPSVKQRFEELIRATLTPKDLITALYITDDTAHAIIPGAPASIFFSDWNRLSPEQLSTPQRMYDGSHPAAPGCQAIWYAVAQNRLLLGDDSDDTPVTIMSLCHKAHPQADTAINAIPGPIKQLTSTEDSIDPDADIRRMLDTFQSDMNNIRQSLSTISAATRASTTSAANTASTAKAAKEAIIAEAEGLKNSTAWDETSRKFNGLMDRWKKAGRAGGAEDGELWDKFREAADVFFNARAKNFQ